MFAKNNTVVNILITGFIISLSFFVVLQSALNPWSVRVPGPDQALWISMAIDMLRGDILYVDIGDHKGPLLFIIHCLGLSITPHSLTGIWLLEWIGWSFTFFFLYKTAKLYTTTLPAAIAITISAQPLVFFFERGNLVESWSLPFTAISLYLFVRYMKTSVFNRMDVFYIGACMISAFLLNGNLVSVWIIFIPYLILKLLLRKEYISIWKSAIWLTAGCISVIFPIMLWLIIQGAFISFLNWHILFNIIYVSDTGIMPIYWSVMNFAYKSDYFVVIHLICFAILIKNRRWDDLIIFAYTVVTLVLLSISGRLYMHYGIQLIPCLLIPATIFVDALYHYWENKKGFVITILILFLAFGRFDTRLLIENIKWTMDAERRPLRHGCWGYKNYQNINNWVWKISDNELLDKMYVDESCPYDQSFSLTKNKYYSHFK